MLLILAPIIIWVLLRHPVHAQMLPSTLLRNTVSRLVVAEEKLVSYLSHRILKKNYPICLFRNIGIAEGP